jgi:hypothetical protein
LLNPLGGNVGIGTSSPATSLHISSGTSGDAKVTIEADTDNSDEGDHPCIRLKQDGGLINYRIGIGTSDGDVAASNNDFCITAENNAASEMYMVNSSGTQYKFWHQGNDGNGSGLDADTVDGIEASSFLRSDATDITTGYLTVDNHFRVANPSAVTGQGDNHTHFNYNDTGVNYIRGTTTIVSSPTLDCQYLRADRIYSNNDGSTGYFFNDSGTRTAYTGGDFYIQSGVTYYYNYATNQYLGSTSGDTIFTRGNRVLGNNFEFAVDGSFKVNAGYGSLQYAYGVRAWGRFELSGTHTWRDDEGFSSITDQGTGRTQLSFTNTMPNSLYAVCVQAGTTITTSAITATTTYAHGTTSFTVAFEDVDAGLVDIDQCSVIVVR